MLVGLNKNITLPSLVAPFPSLVALIQSTPSYHRSVLISIINVSVTDKSASCFFISCPYLPCMYNFFPGPLYISRGLVFTHGPKTTTYERIVENHRNHKP